MAETQGRVEVSLPRDLEPVFTNFAMVTDNHSEFIIDFAQVLPRMPMAKISARVVLTPMNAKSLMEALTEHVKGFEEKHGELPTRDSGLAEGLFKADGDG